MARLASATTTYVNAYLTDIGRKYFSGFDQFGENERFQDDVDLFMPTKFSAYDTDVNYKSSLRLETGDVPDITGSDGCIKSSSDQLRKHILISDREDVPFDFAIIRYIWKEDSWGDNDLDTRTAVFGTGNSSIDGDTVGFGQGSNKVLSGTSTYLNWGGDNTTGGTESVLIDFRQLSVDFDVDTFTIDLRAHWYTGSATQGTCFLQLATYVGGEMLPFGTDFVNVGGAENSIRNVETLLTANYNNDAGDLVGTIVFDTATQKGKLTAV